MITKQSLSNSNIFCGEEYVLSQLLRKSYFYTLLGVDVPKEFDIKTITNLDWSRFDMSDLEIQMGCDFHLIKSLIKKWKDNWKDLGYLLPNVYWKEDVDHLIGSTINPLQCKSINTDIVRHPKDYSNLYGVDQLIMLKLSPSLYLKTEDDAAIIMCAARLAHM